MLEALWQLQCGHPSCSHAAEEEKEGRASQHPAGLCLEAQSAAHEATGAATFPCLLEHAAPSATEKVLNF